MKMFVFSMRDFDELDIFNEMCRKYGVEMEYTSQTPCLANLGMAGGCDAVNVITTAFDAPMIDRLHDIGIKCIASRTIGYDHIDVGHAERLGMGVLHISYSPGTVADYTIMMMLMGLRRLRYIMQRADIQDYTLKGKIGKELGDCTVGVIGTGRIGKAVIQRLGGFGSRVLAYDIFESEEVKGSAEYTDLETIFREADVITLHAPATADSYHMIGSKEIGMMKPGAGIVNCARGTLIDTAALIGGIEDGKIGFAALDVIEQEQGLYYFNRMGEPLGNHDLALLRSYPNVIVTPHTAFYTDHAVADMVENSIIGLKAFMNGEKSPFEV